MVELSEYQKKVGENDRNKRAVWYCPEWLGISTIIIFCESHWLVNFTKDDDNNKSSFITMHMMS